MGLTDVYWNVFARSNNENNSLVLRNSSGNIIGSTITSDLSWSDVTGNASGSVSGSSGSVTGNAATTTKLETEREIAITFTGVIVGTGSFIFDETSETNLIAQVGCRNCGSIINRVTDLSPLPE